MLPVNYSRPSVLNSPPFPMNNQQRQQHQQLHSTQQQQQQQSNYLTLPPLLSTINSIPRPPLLASTSSSEWETKSQPTPGKTTPLGIKKPKLTSSNSTSKSDNGLIGNGGIVKTRVKRSKLACIACKAVKQRCSSDETEGREGKGCRRCQLYALECHFPIGAKDPTTPNNNSNAPNNNLMKPSNGSASGLVSSLRLDQQAGSSIAGSNSYTSSLVQSGNSTTTENLLLQKLSEISTRLNSIETNLSHQETQQREILYQQSQQRELSQRQASLLPPPSPSRGGTSGNGGGYHHSRISSDLARSSSKSHSRKAGSDISEEGEYEAEGGGDGRGGIMDIETEEAEEAQRVGKGTNPLKAVQESFQLVEENEEGTRRTIVGPGGTGDAVYGSPDAVKRGLLTEVECQSLFNIFFENIHPWVMMLDIKEDSQSMIVHARSPLLFHTILLLATSYQNPFPSIIHTTLITFTNAILAPQILSPQPNELNCDFLRAIDLLNLFKPTQIAARRQDGMSEGQAMKVSKLNTLASWMLQGLLSRVCEKIGLPGVLAKFARAYSDSIVKIPLEIIREMRLYFLLLCNDVHGNLQSGRRCNLEGSAALVSTRIFAALNLQPYDCRLAASVEMYELARPILKSSVYERTRRISRDDLERFNSGMLMFESYWRPILLEKLKTDPLAMTVMCPNMDFILLTFNAAAYVSWKTDRHFDTMSPATIVSPTSSNGSHNNHHHQHSSSHNPTPTLKRARTSNEGPRGLNQWEFDSLQRCVKAAENLVFRLSVESRDRLTWRKVKWEEAERGEHFRPLVLDDTLVESCSWAMDANHIARFFSLVFLLKLVNEGLLTADLVLLEIAQVQPPWIYAQKLPRLLELGASFLERLSLNPHHPSKSQAKVLRALLESRISNTPPVFQQLGQSNPHLSQQQQQSQKMSTDSVSSPAGFDPSTPRDTQSFIGSPLLSATTNFNHPSQQFHQQSHQRWSSTSGGSALTSNALSPNLSLQDSAQMTNSNSTTGLDDMTFTNALDGFDLSDTSAFWRDNGIDWSFDYPAF